MSKLSRYERLGYWLLVADWLVGLVSWLLAWERRTSQSTECSNWTMRGLWTVFLFIACFLGSLFGVIIETIFAIDPGEPIGDIGALIGLVVGALVCAGISTHILVSEYQPFSVSFPSRNRPSCSVPRYFHARVEQRRKKYLGRRSRYANMRRRVTAALHDVQHTRSKLLRRRDESDETLPHVERMIRDIEQAVEVREATLSRLDQLHDHIDADLSAVSFGIDELQVRLCDVELARAVKRHCESAMTHYREAEDLVLNEVNALNLTMLQLDRCVDSVFADRSLIGSIAESTDTLEALDEHLEAFAPPELPTCSSASIVDEEAESLPMT